MPTPPSFDIVSVGPIAGAVLGSNDAVRVAAVYATSFYLTPDGRQFVCIGGLELGRGPLNALCAVIPAADWATLGVKDSQRGRIDSGALWLDGGPRFAVAGAEPWTPAPWPADWSGERLITALRDFLTTAGRHLPDEGLAPIVMGKAFAPVTSPFARVATLKIAALEDWLTEAIAGNDEMDRIAGDAVRGLLGLGPGLTPSGDDFIAGLLIALHAMGMPALASRLADFVTSAPEGVTSPLSLAFLDAAIAGHPSESMHAVISALLSNRSCDANALIAKIDAIGHSSGWDMLSGVVVGLAAGAGATQRT